MQGATDNIHLAIDIATPFVLVAVSWVGLAIKNALTGIALTQATTKAELVEHQNEIKEELNRKHAENKQSIAVHTAEDNQRFDSIDKAQARFDGKLDRIDQKLDRLNGHLG